MNTFFKHFLITVLLTVFSTALPAQNSSTQGQQRLTREQLAETQAQYIARVLAMDEATQEKFTTTFLNYQKELWALRDQHRSSRNPNATERETADALKNRFKHSQMILALREKYYEAYSQFLTQRQIERIYELERQMMRRIAGKKWHKNRNRQKGSAPKGSMPAAAPSR